MAESTTTGVGALPLAPDPRRQAVDSFRGTVYQIWRSVFAWLDLSEDEILYLEGAEDFDLARPDSVEVSQVKDTVGSGNKTLRSGDVLDALANYIAVVKRNPHRSIRFKFLTTSGIGIEQGQPFGRDRAGLHVWSACQSLGAGQAANELAKAIRQFLLGLSALPSAVRDFLQAADAARVKAELIDRIEWFCDEPGIPGVIEAIREKLIYECDRKQVPSSEVARIQAVLFEEASRVVVQRSTRTLNRARFLEVFDTATTVSVSRADFEALARGSNSAQLQQVLELAKAAGITPGVLQFRSQQPALQTLPPVPGHLLTRQPIHQTIAQRLSNTPVLLLLGSTGMGKSTLARMYAERDTEQWFWVDCRGSDAQQLHRLLQQVGRELAQDSSKRNLIIDDVDFSGDTRPFELDLLSITFVLKARKGRFVITGHQDAPQRIRLNLCLGEENQLWVPPFSEDEIGVYLLEQGCQAQSVRETWTRLIWLRTSGHPQLVNASVRSVKAQAFRKPDMSDILETPIDIRDARNQARQLIGTELDLVSRDFLYRLSLLTAPFRRDRAIAIASTAPAIPNPGDVLDRLVGPWIERLEDPYYRISPLIRQVGADANDPAWLTAMHRSIAQAMLQFRELTPSEASSILFHGVMSSDTQSIAHMSIGLINAEDEVWPQLASALDWFIHVAPHSEETTRRYTQFGLFAIRMLQYRIAAAVRPDALSSVIAAIDAEFPATSGDVMQKAMRVALLGKMLVRIDSPIPVKETIDKGRELLQLQSTVEGDERFASLKEGAEAKSFDMKEVFAVSLMPRVKTVEHLAEFNSHMGTLGREVASDLLTAFDQDESMAMHLLDSVWLDEFKRPDPRWRELASCVENLYGLARQWNNVGLARAAAITLARVLSEGLSDTSAAESFIKRSISETGISATQLDGQAKVLFNRGDNAGALELWERALEDWVPSRFGAGLEIAFACRTAGIAAARLGDWRKAGELFLRGSEAATTAGHVNLRAGLLSDAGFAMWRAGDVPQSIGAFRQSLVIIEHIDNSPDDIPAYFLHKAVGGVLTYIANRDTRAASEAMEPTPGMCSNTDPDERITQSNPTPIEFSWFHLVKIEAQIGDRNVYAVVRNRLMNAPYAAVRMQIAELEIRRSIEDSDLSPYAANVLALLKALEVLRAQSRTDIKIWEPDPPELVSALPENQSTTDAAALYCLRGLVSISAAAETEAILGTWRVAAKSAGAGPQLNQWFDHLVWLQCAHISEIRAVLRDSSRSQVDRAAAAIFLAMNDGASANDVMAAHITLLIALPTAIPKQLLPSLEHDFARLLQRDWLRMAARPFQLRLPGRNAPSIFEACKSEKTGWAKCAEILSAAAPATSWTVPASLMEALRRGFEPPPYTV